MNKDVAGQLHHVEINVSDLKRSTEFWGWFLELLGYSKFQDWESGKSWKLGNTYLVFVQTEEKHLDTPYHRRKTGLNHLSFHAKSRKQIDDITDQVKKKGIPILYQDRHPYAGGERYYAVYFEDPDRIKVELVTSEE